MNCFLLRKKKRRLAVLEQYNESFPASFHPFFSQQIFLIGIFAIYLAFRYTYRKGHTRLFLSIDVGCVCKQKFILRLVIHCVSEELYFPPNMITTERAILNC